MTSNDMITLRSWQQLSDEIQKRADAQRYPLTGMDPGDVTEALANTATLNRDAWANGWSVIGDRYLNLANKQVKSNRSLACSNCSLAFECPRSIDLFKSIFASLTSFILCFSTPL